MRRTMESKLETCSERVAHLLTYAFRCYCRSNRVRAVQKLDDTRRGAGPRPYGGAADSGCQGAYRGSARPAYRSVAEATGESPSELIGWPSLLPYRRHDRL